MPNYSDQHSEVLKSIDGGESWRQHGHVTTPHGHYEPTIVELSDGTVLMYLRTDDGYIWESRSKDKGETWSKASRTKLVATNSTHMLYGLRNGHIVLAYNPTPNGVRNPLVVGFSADDCITWTNPFIIDEHHIPWWQAGRFVTYPSITEDRHGNLVVTYADYTWTTSELYGDINIVKLREIKS